MIYNDPHQMTLPHIDLEKACPVQKELYLCFMGHIRRVPVSRPEIKILSAIQSTADRLHISDAHVSKELVEMGLRAPRLSFPLEFLDFIDRSMMRCGWDIGAPSSAMVELRDVWFENVGQDRLPLFRHVHAIVQEDVLETI
ncbi:MAG: hypothetical protein ACRBDL_10030 [Alphaproteobacteria bacterium]